MKSVCGNNDFPNAHALMHITLHKFIHVHIHIHIHTVLEFYWLRKDDQNIEAKPITSNVIGSHIHPWFMISISCLQVTWKFWQQFKFIYLKIIEETKGQTCLGIKHSLWTDALYLVLLKSTDIFVNKERIHMNVCDQSCLG